MSKRLAILGGPRAIPEGAVLSSPPVTAEDEAAVMGALRSGVHAWGSNCDELQREWAEWNGNTHCMALNSGTAALHMCLAACGLSAGDEVLTPAYSWTSSATCILHHNCIPVFVDVDPLYANVDPSRIEDQIGPRTRAIIVVHLHGAAADMDPILATARKHGLFVIEDGCQAHGTRYRGRKVGTIGHCAAFSLNQNKMLSCGEGGLFVTDDAEMIEHGRSLVLFGDFRMPLDDLAYHSYGLGWMYRANNITAALARSQLRRLDESIAHSRHLFGLMRRELAGVPGLVLPSEAPGTEENGYNFVCHVAPERAGYDGQAGYLRQAVVAALQAEGVPAMVWQREILPEFAAIAARNAYGNGSPWREHDSSRRYDPGEYPNALKHADSYFILGGLRQPNGEDLACRIAEAVRKVFGNLGSLDIDAIARTSDVSIYERGWRRHADRQHLTRQ